MKGFVSFLKRCDKTESKSFYYMPELPIPINLMGLLVVIYHSKHGI